MGARVPQHQPEHRHVPLRQFSKRPLFKWLGLATAGALLIGTAPAAGSLPARGTAATADSSPSAKASPGRSVQPVFAMVTGTSPLRDPSAGSGLDGGDWTPGYQPEITSDISPDGSPGDGEGIPSRRGADHVATGPAGLLPGGLALAAPVESTRITSGFGWRLNPTGPGSYIHIGQDYGVACGTPVRAAADGRVVQSAWAGHSGQRVRVDHGSGVETAYSHNSLLVAGTGERVHRGDLLALSGTTGNSTGCHVHFEVYLNGKWGDPAKYLPLVPGQKRPVSEQELRQIARSRTSPAPSPSPSPRTTTSSSISPAPSQQAARSSAAAASKTPSAARPDPQTPKAPKPAVQPRPTQSTPTPTSTDRPQAAGSQPKPQATEEPRPLRPTQGKTTAGKPSTPAKTRRPSSSSTSAPPTAAPVESSSPGEKPTAKPTPSETQPPKSTPIPIPSPTPGEPTTPPDPEATAPPTLSELCLAYQNEYEKEDQAHKESPKPHESRILGELEIGFLTEAVDAQPREPNKPDSEELTSPLTVRDVAGHCDDWFPAGIDETTAKADIKALLEAAVVKLESAKDTEGAGK